MKQKKINNSYNIGEISVYLQDICKNHSANIRNADGVRRYINRCLMAAGRKPLDKGANKAIKNLISQNDYELILLYDANPQNKENKNTSELMAVYTEKVEKRKSLQSIKKAEEQYKINQAKQKLIYDSMADSWRGKFY